MPNCRRVSLGGSEELVRPTRPEAVSDHDDVVKDTVDRRSYVKEVVVKTLNFTLEEIELLLDAVQIAKYPDRARAKPALDRFDTLDGLRQKIQAVVDQ